MAKPKNGKAKRIYKEQAQVQAVQHEQIKAKQRKSSTRFNRWVFSLLALMFVTCAGFAVAESRAVQVERVNNQARSIDDEDVDPKTWRSLKLVMSKSDGGKVEIGLSRPTWWIEQVGAEEGKSIHLNIPEMQLSGPTKVVSITEMEPGPPRGAGVVTGTFKHTSADVLNLQLQGEKAPIGVTATHPFRSADRNAWIGAGQLKVGERVVTRNGTTKVVSVKKRLGSEPVYNLEVHKTHTYFVGSTGGGAWVHNACPEGGPFFRGGPDVTNVRPIDVVIKDGLVQPKKGVSLFNKPDGMERFGGPHHVANIPDELTIIQRGQNPNHFEIIPKQPMPMERYQELLRQVELVPHP